MKKDKICQFKIESLGNLDPEDKFIEIMKYKKEVVIAALGKCIYNCMIKRYKLLSGDRLALQQRVDINQI